MPEFMLSVHHDYSRPLVEPGVDVEPMYAAVARFNEELQATGAWVFAGGLETPGTAQVVEVADGELVVTDGPVVPTGKALGGFWVIDVPDVEAAVTWAQRASVAVSGPIEVRPFQA